MEYLLLYRIHFSFYALTPIDPLAESLGPQKFYQDFG